MSKWQGLWIYKTNEIKMRIITTILLLLNSLFVVGQCTNYKGEILSDTLFVSHKNNQTIYLQEFGFTNCELDEIIKLGGIEFFVVTPKNDTIKSIHSSFTFTWQYQSGYYQIISNYTGTDNFICNRIYLHAKKPKNIYIHKA